MRTGRGMWHRFRVWYFEPKPFEMMGNCRLYRLLGVRAFKRYLPTSGDLVTRRRGISRIKRVEGGVAEGLRRYERITRSYEARHIFGGLSMLAISWWSIAVHGKGNWVALLAANVSINGYPIMLQRYNRIRLQRALGRRAPVAGGGSEGGESRNPGLS